MTLDERITHIQDAYRLAFRSLAKREVAYKHEIANTHKRLEAELRADIEDAIKEYHTPKQTHRGNTHRHPHCIHCTYTRRASTGTHVTVR